MTYRTNYTPLAERADEIASLLKVLSHPHRLRIAIELLDKELAVGELAALANIEQPSLSRELARFRALELVNTRRRSKEILYSLSDERLVRLLEQLEGAANSFPTPPEILSPESGKDSRAVRRSRSHP